MNKRLYRFRILREETQQVFVAEDEADNSQVWLVKIPLDARKRSEQIKNLLAIFGAASDAFTALGSLYLVAKSKSSARSLLTTAQDSIADKPEPVSAQVRTPAEKKPEPAPSRGPTWGPSQEIKKKEGLKVPKAAWAVLGGLLACGLIIGSVLFRPKADQPVVRQVGSGAGEIAISESTPNAAIHYTTDGSEPTASSPVYSSPLRGLASGTTVRAFAVAPGRSNSSIASGYYTTPEDYLRAQAAFDQGRREYNRGLFMLARNSFHQSCQGEILEACDYLGVMYARGLGGPASESAARGVLENACNNGSMASCVSLGNIEQANHQFASAREHYQKACESSYKKGCDYLRWLH